MAYASINGIKLYYRIDGVKPDAPWLVLSNSLGSDVGMWAPQVQAFAEHFRVLRYDTRGHGRSDAPRGPYTIEQLTGDVIGLMDHLGIARANYLGLSMGGAHRRRARRASRRPLRAHGSVEHGSEDRHARDLAAARGEGA